MQTAKPYSLSLELYAGEAKQTGILYYAGDKDVYPLRVRLLADGKPHPLEAGTTAFITFRLPDGRVEKCTMETESPAEGRLLHRILGSEIALPGAVEAAVELQDSRRRLTWQPFVFRVAAAADSAGATPPQPYAQWTRDVNEAVAGLRSRVTRLEQDGGSGGNGGGGYSPYIDPRTQTWWEYDDEAAAYRDSGVTAQGPAGQDGLTTAVNGVVQVDGRIALTAADIPYTDERLPGIGDVYGALGHLAATIGALGGGLDALLGV